MNRTETNDRTGKVKLFDKALFCEGIRQTKWIGIIGLVVCAFLGFLDYMGYGYSEILFLVVMLIVSIMVIQLFLFLNKRNAGDFYCMLPERKHTVYMTYLMVIILWSVLLVAFWSAVSWLEIAKVEEEWIAQGAYVMDEGGSSVETFFTAFFYGFSRVVLLIGAIALAMSTTGSTLTAIIVMLILVVLPNYIFRLYDVALSELIPYGSYNSFYVNPNVMVGSSRLQYEYMQSLLSSSSVAFEKTKILNVYTSICFLGESGGLIAYLKGVIYLIAGGVAFCKRKSEMAEHFVYNRKWKGFLRILLAIAIGISADKMLAESYFKVIEWEEFSKGVIWPFVWVVIVWVAFEIVLTRKWKHALRSLRQLPIIVGVNAVVAVSFIVACYLYSSVPAYEEIQSVQIMTKYEIGSTAGNGYEYFEATSHQFTDELVKNLVYERLEKELTDYLHNQVEYEEYSERNEAIQVAIHLENETLVRYLHLYDSEKRIIFDAYIDETSEIYDYELPLETNVVGYGDCISFGWDFSDYEFEKLYETYRMEAAELNLPLSTYLGREQHPSGVYDFLIVYPEQMSGAHANKLISGIEIPISIETPKTVAMLANLGNENRKDYNFDWFVEYIKSIKNQEKGGTLELILYVDGEEEIRYRSFGWWSDWSWDMELEQLEEIQKIAKTHETDEAVSGEGNLMLLFYKNIDGVETTGHWYNVSDSEAQIIKEIIGENHYFTRYKYFQYY